MWCFGMEDKMKKICSSMISLFFVLTFVSVVTMKDDVSATCKSGIKNNGLGGIFIDINSEPYTSFDPEYAYGGVVAWFTSARVKHLTGKGDVSRSGVNWWNNADSYGFSKGYTPQAPAIICWKSGQSAILEKIEGSTAYISRTGDSSLTDKDHGYTVIQQVSVSSIESLGSDFLGYLYLPSLGGNNPNGTVDAITGQPGKIAVSGWAFDQDNVQASLEIHVYIGGPASSSDAECHVIKADKSRTDVNTAHPGVGNNHGFSEVISTNKTGNQAVYIYAKNVGGGKNQELGHKTVSITPTYIPQGSLDSVTPVPGGVRVKGWAFDRDDLKTSLEIHVHIAGKFVGTLKADRERKDVNKLHGCGDYHGFDGTLKTSLTGSQQVDVYAKNILYGASNLKLGSKTVTIYKDDCTDPSGHSYSKTPVIKPATTSADGSVSYYCNNCKKAKSTTIAKINEVSLSAASFTYSGSVQKPSIRVMDSDGKEISDSNYTVTYLNPQSCEAGTYSLTVLFNGNYSGSITKSYEITKIKQDDKTVSGESSKENQKSGSKGSLTVTNKAGKSKKIKMGRIKVKNKKRKRVKVSWKKLSKVTGYQIQYSVNKKFKKAKNVSTKKGNYTIKKLKKKKTYYIRVRAYKKNGKKKIYGSWSKVKKVKIKY